MSINEYIEQEAQKRFYALLNESERTGRDLLDIARERGLDV